METQELAYKPNQMADKKRRLASRYVSVLESRPSEIRAFSDLSASTKTMMLPLLEITRPQGKDTELCKYVTNLATKLSSNWGNNLPIALDFAKCVSGSQKLSRITSAISGLQYSYLKYVLVTGPERGDAFQQAIKSDMSRGHGGLCIRVRMADLSRPEGSKRIHNLVEQLEVDWSDVDLVFDFGVVDFNDVSTFTSFAVAQTGRFAPIRQVRSFTILSGAFPRDLSTLKPGIGKIPQYDLFLWRKIVHANGVIRSPDFGDYGIQRPMAVGEEHSGHIGSPSIRYTARGIWYVFRGIRGRSPERARPPQYKDHCEKLVKHPAFGGLNCCECDRHIFGVTTGKKPGDLSTWRRAGTVHHLSSTVRRLIA